MEISTLHSSADSPREFASNASVGSRDSLSIYSARAAALGLLPEACFEDIVRQYIADHANHPDALRGMHA